MPTKPRHSKWAAGIAILAAVTVAGCVTVRKEINDLSAQEIDDFRKGVERMQSRPVANNTSWLYQANIHGTSNFGTCPATGGGAQPAWDTCQHGQYYFLCWHRMYLYYVERILRGAVREATGDANRRFALPFWDYAANPSLPAAFRTPANATNPLFVSQRRASCNNGGTCVTAGQASATVALGRTRYCKCPAGENCTDCIDTFSPSDTFGGERVAAPVHFSNRSGQLELQPHNVVHNAVGAGGWMSDPGCAARDPIFYLHHANIDRLWQVWLNQGGGRADPVNEASWRNVSFTFIDADGSQVTKRCCDVVHTRKQLGYVYKGVPVTNVKYCPKIILATRLPPLRETELIWKLQAEPMVLRDGTTRVPLDVAGAARETLAAMAEASRPDGGEQVLLTVEGIQRLAPGAIYEVYLGAGVDEGLTPEAPSFVGNIALFGPTGEEGVDLTFDVSRQVQRSLAEDPAAELTLGFVFFDGDGEQTGPSQKEGGYLSVETVSLARRAKPSA